MKIDNERTGIVPGRGSDRGWAHIGVLNALADLGIKPERILSPQLSHLGLMEFYQSKLAIAEGRACVERNRSTLENLFLTKK
jgi:NTE family protein